MTEKRLIKGVWLSIFVVATSASLLAGCGEDKTTYESTSTTTTTAGSGTTTTTSGGSSTTTTTIGGTTTTTSGSTADGATLFANKCASCHGAKNAGGTYPKVTKPTSVSTIKSNNMSMGLTDDQLSAVATYINGL